jgi:MFS family permease
MTTVTLTLDRTNRIYRLAAGCLFFMLGLCFASWASRIPSIQQSLHLSDAALGVVLFALPVGSMISMPFSGWLVTKYGSKRVVTNAIILYSLLLISLGFAQSLVQLIITLILFGIAGNLTNIAVNTQALGVEARYGRKIMASFHGLWSLAGFTAAGVGTLMIGQNIIPLHHFMLIAAIILLAVAICFQYLLPTEVKPAEKTPLFPKPDKPLVMLGIITFCCRICEGAMFDWSGIYLKKVVQAEPSWIGAGYTAFMCTMATGRFVADWITHKIGFKRTVQGSGVLIATGLLIAVVFPYLLSAIIGFLLVGFGVSSVVPLVYSEAGRSSTIAPGVALAAVSSIGFLGFLIGPPLIGVVAGMAGLQTSFIIIAVMGLNVALMASLRKEK